MTRKQLPRPVRVVGRNIWAWVNHAALNLGEAIRCLWHVVLPPQIDHPQTTVRSLAKSQPVKEFFIGLGWWRRRATDD